MEDNINVPKKLYMALHKLYCSVDYSNTLNTPFPDVIMKFHKEVNDCLGYVAMEEFYEEAKEEDRIRTLDKQRINGVWWNEP